MDNYSSAPAEPVDGVAKGCADPDLARQLVSRWEGMKNDRAVWDTLWQDIADYVLPRKAEIQTRTRTPSTARADVLYDTTAVYANQTLANGQMTYMTPADSPWFSFDVPAHKKGDDDAAQWFQQCTQITQRNLANSNFYSEIHELYFDDGGFGTANMIVLPGRNNALNFQNLQVGTYCLAEDDEGLVDTCFRELHLTGRQAEMKFGRSNLSTKMQRLLDDEATKGGSERKHGFLHAIYPRTERERGKVDGPNKPFASVYVELEGKHVVSNGGFDEKPFFATRHLKWGDSVYGYSPSWIALPEARQLNFLTKQLDALAEVKAFPRMLIPDTMEGEVDVAAGGITFFDPNLPSARPTEWMTAGDYNIGMDREKRKQDAIEKAYYVDMFRMFANLDKQMTAREVAERTAEKLTQFTPAFARKTTELFTPLLRRVFGIQLRAGLFPQPPPGVFDQDQRSGELYVSEPEVAYNSRIALAIRAQDNVAFSRSLDLIQPILQLKPEVLDSYDFDQITRDGGRNDGLPPDWFLPMEKVNEIRQQRAEAQAQQQKAQQMQAMADSMGKVGKIKSDSLVAQALAQGGGKAA